MLDLKDIFNLGYPSIPQVYTDALSYTEQVAKLCGGVVKIAELANTNESNLKKKVSYEDMLNIYKLSQNADFRGSWFGIKHPVESEPGIQGQVYKNIEDIQKLNTEIVNLREYLQYMPINGGDFDGNNPPNNPYIDGGVFSALKGGE